MKKYLATFIKYFPILLLLPYSTHASSGSNKFQRIKSVAGMVNTYILWNYSCAGEDSIDQYSFKNAFQSIGLSPSLISSVNLGKNIDYKNALIIIPHASASLLKLNEIDQIKHAIKEGACVITDGKSKLASAMDIKLSHSSSIRYIRDLTYPSMQLQWADNPQVPFILNSQDESTRKVYADSITGNSVGILMKSGKGMFLYLSALFDPISGDGYSRFPNLTNLVVKEMNCMPPLRRQGLEAYYDPGYPHELPIEKLVSVWKSWGIKAIHAAAWYFYESPSYNYELLINEAHRQGIIVYAWLEWPYVGMGFWNAHPEWRMKNALLLDAQLDFLSLMDLQNPDCMKRVMSDLSTLLKYDWDGIDVAEFSITGGVSEALEGPQQPKYFTGFNATARNEFKSIYGFDQTELFDSSSVHFWKNDSVGLDKFYKYRVQVNNRLLRHIVNSLDSIKVTDKRDWEFIFTVLDNSLHPEFDQLLGFDLTNTFKIAKEFHATLQVEDPASEWNRPPSRYDQLAKTYLKLAPDIPLAIDINIVPIHSTDQKEYASSQPTGSELFQQFYYADKNCGRVCFYAESSVFEHDWQVLPFAMASGSTITKEKYRWKIVASNTLLITNTIKHGVILLDKKQWPCFGKEGIIIPKGEHYLSFDYQSKNYSHKKNSMQITGISAELISCTQVRDGIDVRYKSPARCFITTNKLPNKIKIDGVSATLKIARERESFIIYSPSGSHRIQLYN